MVRAGCWRPESNDLAGEDLDEPPEGVFYCPDCAEPEFGDG